jgi:uncharacterized ferritin-like protein (DUF455 family)
VPAKSKTIDDPIERIARVLAIIAVKGLDNEKAARRLLAAGFDAKQIGGLLDVNPNFAHVAKGRKRKTVVKGRTRKTKAKG